MGFPYKHSYSRRVCLPIKSKIFGVQSGNKYPKGIFKSFLKRADIEVLIKNEDSPSIL